MGNVWQSWLRDAGWVDGGVMALLLAMSLAVWTVVFLKVSRYVGLWHAENDLSASLAAADSVQELAHLPWGVSLTGQLYQRLAAQLAQRPPRTEDALEGAFRLALRQVRAGLDDHMTLLATIGSSAPFIGLLGTVWGILNALRSLGGVSQLTLDQVAGPVGQALLATAVGLFTAIPALLAYNTFLRLKTKLVLVLEGNEWHLHRILLAQYHRPFIPGKD